MTDVLIVACCLWDANDASLPFSRHYTEQDVERLYRGWKRNLTRPFKFVCFTERDRVFEEPILQARLTQKEPDYGALIEPFKLDVPMIVTGLDTVIVGNCDAFADYCFRADKLAAPRDPFAPERVCNGVVLAPKGFGWLWEMFPGGNDMAWIRRQDVERLDDLWPRQIVSYKGHVKHFDLEEETRIVYFHGQEKPHQLPQIGWIVEHWR